MSKTGVVFVNYHTEKAIAHIYEQFVQIPDISNIVIVDNSPCTENRAFFKEKCPAAKLFFSKGNTGYSRANNYAMKYLDKQGCDYFIIANSDINISTDNITALIRNISENQEYGVLAPIMFDNNNRMVELRTVPLGFKRAWLRLFKGLDKNSLNILPSTNGIIEQTMVSGSLFIANAKAMKKCNYLDPNIFLYREEEALAMRMEGAGYKVGVVAKLKYIHLHDYTGTSFGAYYKQLKREFFSERYYFRTYLKSGKLEIGFLTILQLLFSLAIFKSLAKNKLLRILGVK